MTKRTCRVNMWVAAIAVTGLLTALPAASSAQSISGNVKNQSRWADTNLFLTPPGDGGGSGVLRVGLWNAAGGVEGPPFTSSLLDSGTMPFPFNQTYAYSLGGALPDGTYSVVAWVDANNDGQYNFGEPRSAPAQATINNGQIPPGVNVTVLDDSDNDKLPDYWEAHWFAGAINPLAYGAQDDPDKDGLTNLREYQEGTNPADWDTDGDGMDDGFEVKYKGDSIYTGLNPLLNDSALDADGDGLSNYQEYLGVDGIPPLETDSIQDGVRVAKHNSTTDELNPLDIDSDLDLLVDSFEVAWYDPANGIDPAHGALSAPPTNGVYDLSIAMADTDQDGLSNYREQCLQISFRQGGANGDKWTWLQGPYPIPFAYHTYQTPEGATVRMCNLGGFSGGTPLVFAGMQPLSSVRLINNRNALRAPAVGWTDPTEGSGYNLTDENIPPGHDTDNDGLPDGWEVEFGLDPRDPGNGPNYDNGPFGDPDGDGLLNYEEYLGQDGNRSATKPYVNGTGDETNPNVHNWRPDSTYDWRWKIANPVVNPISDPRDGNGLNRNETLGGALPTLSIGTDNGTDSDDDGIPDALEVNPPAGTPPSSPVHSTDPFIMRSALITSPSGIIIPDPEPAIATNLVPAGFREDLQRRDWTIECLVKLLDVNMTGDLFNYNTSLAGNTRVVYRLQLSNNAPVLTADINGTRQIVTGNALPTNQWIHLAAVWDHNNNNLALYIQGVLFIGKAVFGESVSTLSYPSTNVLAFGVSSGSFVNKLVLDEIRIWGIARTAPQISKYAYKLLPQNNGDDVWIASTPGALFYRTNDALLVNGGSLFEGEPGSVLNNVLVNNGNYWIDDGDGIYQSANDTLIYHGSGAVFEGAIGTAVANVYFNDKDGSGGYTRDSLLAYYRFDDGGTTAEDFARKAKNGLKGATLENYFFGDFGYALPTNNFSWVTVGAAPVLGVDRRGSDDTDGDGLPDAWEVVYQLNPLDNGAHGETSFSAKDGPYGAAGDPDHDGLHNLYEFWSGTNPREADSDGNGISDAQEDYDGDGIVNLTEQLLGSRPDMVDTDDDGIADNVEQGNQTSLVDPLDPPVSRAVHLGGSASDYLEVPLNLKQRLTSWTIEALVRPDSLAAGPGLIVRRTVENISGGNYALNYAVGIESNGSGGLRAYAGFVQSSGQQSIIRGGLLPVGVYTHVAATYDNQTATMVLYVGGLAVASNSTFSLAPPVNGRGGETFVRIGEDFGGFLDEVRIWNIARTSAQISLNLSRTVPTADPTLVHYFRFDDGQAITNIVPFSASHQPQGAQDFTYSADWNDQWRHAANLHGTVEFSSPGGLVPPPTLRVNLLPAAAVALGAQWAVDGGNYLDTGASIDLTAGIHTLIFKSIQGWTSPTNETITLTNGVVTTITRSYLQNGVLTINIEPAAARATGAMFRVDGGAFLASGTSATNLYPGAHSIDYAALPGWSEPASEVVTVVPGSTTTLTRAYSVAIGYLQIVLSPSNILSQGAQWRINGGSWNNSGTKLALQTGNYATEYRSVAGWVAPSNETIAVLNNSTATLGRAYSVDTNSVDTDHDGLSDAWEIHYFGSLAQGAAGDPDGDGLSNLQEFQLGTDPTKADTDGDGFSDYVEVTRGSNPLDPNSIPPKKIINDFDGDGATDLTVFWPQAGNWYIRSSSTLLMRVQNWGYSGVQPVPADYDGDNITDLAVRDTNSGVWYILPSSNQIPKNVGWTVGTDIVPVPADYDGDKKADVAVFKQSLGNWYIVNSAGNGSTKAVNWGWNQVLPVPGDYDGDGKTDLAVYYPSGGLWYIMSSMTGTMYGNVPVQWGFSQAIPVPGDYDGDRKTDCAVYYPATGTWYIKQSSNGQTKTIQWGWSQALPEPGDYDNDGKTDIAVYYPQTGQWYIRKSSNGQMMTGAAIQFGWSQALPPHAP